MIQLQEGQFGPVLTGATIAPLLFALLIVMLFSAFKRFRNRRSRGKIALVVLLLLAFGNVGRAGKLQRERQGDEQAFVDGCKRKAVELFHPTEAQKYCDCMMARWLKDTTQLQSETLDDAQLKKRREQLLEASAKYCTSQMGISTPEELKNRASPTEPVLPDLGIAPPPVDNAPSKAEDPERDRRVAQLRRDLKRARDDQDRIESKRLEQHRQSGSPRPLPIDQFYWRRCRAKCEELTLLLGARKDGLRSASSGRGSLTYRTCAARYCKR